MKAMLPLLVAFSALAAGCHLGPLRTFEASAELHRVTASGVEPAVVGWGNFTETGRQRFTLVLDVFVSNLSRLSPGEHGLHVHEVGSCDPGPASATNSTVVAAGSAGGHFNPGAERHPDHAGDLPNLVVGPEGVGRHRVFPEQLTVRDADDDFYVVGRALVVHANRDDGMTDPSGNSGARVLCGVIEAA